MSIRESSATALVRARGLGIFCLNPERKQGEMALIRDGRHSLAIRVAKPVFVDGSGRDAVQYREIIAYQSIDAMNVTIEIEGVEPSIEGYEIYAPGDFDRLGEDVDENDFRWLVNIDGAEMHGRRLAKAESASGRSRPPVSRLFIRNALFYARTINENLFFEKVRRDETGAAVERTPFGHVAETVAAKIEAARVVLRIAVGAETHTHVLPRVAGSPYRIEIENMDPDQETPVSDMPDYYNFLAAADGVSFDLEPLKTDETSGGPIGKLTSCHAIVSDAGSIDEFLP
ncbi:MAG: hypothetical protein JSS81_10700 [Acidobacteria bacterium]|nr:hypothetical protein [Acidobacteriota bacterium]